MHDRNPNVVFHGRTARPAPIPCARGCACRIRPGLAIVPARRRPYDYDVTVESVSLYAAASSGRFQAS